MLLVAHVKLTEYGSDVREGRLDILLVVHNLFGGLVAAGGSHLDFGLFLHVKKGTKQRVGDVVDVDGLNVVLRRLELERGVVRAVVVVGFDLVPEVESRQFIAICFGAYLRRAVAEYQSIKFDG